MDKKRAWLVALAVLSLLIAASLACGPSAPSAPPEEAPVEPTATTAPPPPPPAEETPEAAESPEAVETPEEEPPFALEESALNDLDSYAYHFRMEFSGITEGEFQAGSWEGNGKIQNKPTRAMHIVWKMANEEEGYMEWLYIEDEGKMWTRDEEGGEWTEFPMADPSMIESFTLLGFWGALSFAEPEDASFAGLDVVNGIPTRHYRAAAFSGISPECTF
ncbi:MAG: hypothetical protein ACE5II_04450, partial [Anaerolineae bacterium]